MVAQRAEIRLVDCVAHELGCILVVIKHVLQRVLLFFDPKLVRQLHIVLQIVGEGLACVGDYVLTFGDRTNATSESPDEKIVPGFKAVERGTRIANEFLGEIGHCGTGPFAKPSPRLVDQNVAGSLGLEKFSPLIENFLPVGVCSLVQERGVSVRGTHRPVQDDVDGEADKPVGVVPGCPQRHDVVDEEKHLIVVLNLRCLRWSLALHNLGEHLRVLHVQRGVLFYGVFEFLYESVQRHARPLFASTSVMSSSMQPLLDEFLVLW